MRPEEVVHPDLPREKAEYPQLGGDGVVYVKALMLNEMLDYSTAMTSKYGHVSDLLARTVVHEDGQPVKSAAQWEVFGHSRKGRDCCMDLHAIAQRLCGMDGAAKKDAVPG